MKNKCYNGGDKHKFESRYDDEGILPKLSEELVTEALIREALDDLKDLYVKRIYVKDICVWCGKSSKRDS